MTASACARSILPFKNARRVNSPGAAGKLHHVFARKAVRCGKNGRNALIEALAVRRIYVPEAACIARHIAELRAGNRLKNTVADRAGLIARNANNSDAARRRSRRDRCNGFHSLSLLLVRCTCNTFSFCIIPRGEKIVTQNVGKRRKFAEKKRLLYPFGDAFFSFLCLSYSAKSRTEQIAAYFKFLSAKTSAYRSIRRSQILIF